LPGGGDPDYSSLATWEADTDYDISSLGKVTLDCYDSQVHEETYRYFSGASGLDDTHYRCVRSSPNCAVPFAGHPDSGASFFKSDDLSKTSYYLCFVETHFVCQDISASYYETSPSQDVNMFQQNGMYGKVLRCIAYNGYNGSLDCNGFSVAVNYGALAINCIAMNNNGDGFIRTYSSFNPPQFICCSAIENKGYGFNLEARSDVYNCYAKGNVFGDFFAGSETSRKVFRFNASLDETAKTVFGVSKNTTLCGSSVDIKLDTFGRPYSGEAWYKYTSGEWYGRSPYPRFWDQWEAEGLNYFPIATETWDVDFALGDWGDNSDTYNYRCLISGEDITTSGEYVYLHFYGVGPEAGHFITHASIGERSGESWDFVSAPTELTLGGLTSWSIYTSATTGSYLGDYCDPVSFHIEPGKDYLVHVMVSGEHDIISSSGGKATSQTALRSGETDYTLTQGFSYSELSTHPHWIAKAWVETMSGEVSGEAPDPDWNLDITGYPRSKAVDAVWSVGAAEAQDWELSGEVDIYQAPVEVLRDFSGEDKLVDFYQSPVEVLRDFSGEDKLVDFYQSPIEVLRGYPKTRAYQEVVEVMSCFSGENVGKLYQMPVEVLSSRAQAGGANTSRMFVISS